MSSDAGRDSGVVGNPGHGWGNQCVMRNPVGASESPDVWELSGAGFVQRTGVWRRVGLKECDSGLILV